MDEKSPASDISIIIPTLNEEGEIGSCIQCLRTQSVRVPGEIIVADGGSSDRTVACARAARVRVLECESSGRAIQMNRGAQVAHGEIYLFLHADVRPPGDYLRLIRDTLAAGYDFGCFAYRFDRSSLPMRINSYLTKYDGLWAGGGDQGLFVRRDLFKKVGGYDESHLLMEDFDLYRRLKRAGRGRICPHRLTVSARKYRENGYLRVQVANLLVYSLYQAGMKQAKLAALYSTLLR